VRKIVRVCVKERYYERMSEIARVSEYERERERDRERERETERECERLSFCMCVDRKCV